jgi:hypothetical protein
MEEITEEPVALVERVAALGIGKATLTACVRVPHAGQARTAPAAGPHQHHGPPGRCWDCGTGWSAKA